MFKFNVDGIAKGKSGPVGIGGSCGTIGGYFAHVFYKYWGLGFQ